MVRFKIPLCDQCGKENTSDVIVGKMHDDYHHIHSITSNYIRNKSCIFYYNSEKTFLCKWCFKFYREMFQNG